MAPQAAFPTLYRQHAGMVRRALRQLGVPPGSLDDAVQDVFEVLVRRIHDYDARYEPQRWLWGISRRVAWKHRGQAQRSDRVVELSPGGAAVQAPQERAMARAQARALLDEALEVALLAGHDRLAADIVNGMLIAMSKESAPSWTEARRLGALARGLVGQHGEDDELLGFIAMNVGSVHRVLGRHDEALASYRRAIEYLERTGKQVAVAQVRLNVLSSMLMSGRIEETTTLYEDVATELEQTMGVNASLAISARRNQIVALSLLGRLREAYERSLVQIELIRANFAPTADTYQRALNNAFVYAVSLGEFDDAERLRDELMELRSDDPRMQLYYQVLFLSLPMAKGELDGLEQQLSVVAERAQALEDQVLWWQAREALARLYIVQGRREAAAEIVADPRLGGLLENGILTGQGRVTALLIAVISGAAPPSEGWEAWLLPEGVPFPTLRPSVAAARAMVSGGPVDEVQHQRDEVARLYHRGYPDAQIIDAWLALASPPAP
ncbi:MAG: sigma-70 family RNA polymerase sigma factor [Myxococcales bacterium]|nr:sigma-70 family RNA polymerase sigma factor [Myxococcales bacterium]